MITNQQFIFLIISIPMMAIGIWKWKLIGSFLKSSRFFRVRMYYNDSDVTERLEYDTYPEDNLYHWRGNAYHRGPAKYEGWPKVKTYLWKEDVYESLDPLSSVSTVDPGMIEKELKKSGVSFWDDTGTQELMKWVTIATAVGVVIVAIMLFNQGKDIKTVVDTLPLLPKIPVRGG